MRSIYSDTGILYRFQLKPESARRISNHRQIGTYVLQCFTEKMMDLDELIRQLRNMYHEKIRCLEDENYFNKESRRDAVQILTIHSAKGLEFPVVFMAGGSGLYPVDSDYIDLQKESGGREYWLDTGNKIVREQKGLQIDQEKRRLYYVALTRAKYKLYLPIFDDYETPTTDGLFDSPSANSPSKSFLSRCLTDASNNDKASYFYRESGLSKSKPDSLPERTEKSNQRAIRRMIEELQGMDKTPGCIQLLKDLNMHKRRQMQTSYSALTAGLVQGHLQGRENKDEYHEDRKQLEENIKEAELPRGAATGNMLHEILENISFDTVASVLKPRQLLENPEIRKLITAKMRTYHISEQYSQESCEIIWKVLQIKIYDPFSKTELICLGDLTQDLYKTEMEFHFTFGGNGCVFPKRDLVAGYVIGYIDLLFRYRDRYYILDWKSNWLKKYDQEHIKTSMDENKYTVQAMLYSLALHKWLGCILEKEYDYSRDFGGVIYIYLRGVGVDADQSGIYTDRPSQQALNKKFPDEMQKLFYGGYLASVLNQRKTR